MMLSKTERYTAELKQYAPDDKELVAFLLNSSNLPGKRGNLELAFMFANYIEGHYSNDPETAFTFCERLINENPASKYVTGPEEFLPFCGILGLGRIGKIDPGKEPDVLRYIKSSARDERWRIREAVAMAIQDLIDDRPEVMMSVLHSWMYENNYLLHRAIAAGIAEPRFMKNREMARMALEMHKVILENVARATDQHDPDYLVLVKGLSYTLSVVIVGVEQEGFEYLEDLLATDHPIIQKIVRENLKKARLIRLNAERVAKLQHKMERTA